MLCCFKGQSKSSSRKAESVPAAPLTTPQLDVPVTSPCPKGLLILHTKDPFKEKPAGQPIALVQASLGVGSYSVELACISAPAGYTPAIYAQLLSALAAHDGMFRAALWATSTMQGPANKERTMTLKAAAPPGWDAACAGRLTALIQLHYTQHHPALSGSTAVPAVCLEHLSSIQMDRTSSDFSHLPPGDPPLLHQPQSPKTCSFKFLSSSRFAPSHVGSGVSQVASRASSLTAARSSNPAAEQLQQLQNRRSQLMHGELPVLLTLFTQDGHVLEQNFNSALYYGQIKGKPMWKGDLSRKIVRAELEEAEPEAETGGPLEQLFMLAPVELKMLLEHLEDPSLGPWKGTIQVTPTGLTSESTIRESPGRPSLGPSHALETASSIRPGGGSELPPAAVPMIGQSPFACTHARMSHPGHPDALLDSNTMGVGSLTASHPILPQASAASANSFGTARYVELPPPPVGLDRRASTASVGGVTSRNASSRLASQLAVKKRSQTFHEKSMPNAAHQGLLESQPLDLSRNPSEMPSMLMSSSGPKGLSPYGSLACDGSLGRDSQFFMRQRSQSFVASSPDDSKTASRLKPVMEPWKSSAIGKQPSDGSRKGQFELVDWGSKDVEPSPFFARSSREKTQEQQQQHHKRRSQDSGSPPTASMIEHAAHKRASNTSRSSFPVATANPQDRRSHGGGGKGVTFGVPAAEVQAARRASVRRSSSCSDLGNLSGATHHQDRQQVDDRVQGFDSGQLAQLPSGLSGEALQGFNHGWQARTIDEEELQDLEGLERSGEQDPQRTSAHESDAKNRQVAKPESFLYHEVEVKLVPDPVTNRPAFLLIQRDVSEQVELENLLAELIEDQLAMLSQVFPRHVIQALTTQGAVTLDNIADLTFSHMDVTILFLDIVSFTSTCGKESVTPESVITFLNVLFSRFDKLVQKYQVQKIDTIGDAYLVASGILAPDGEGFWAVDQDHDAAQGAGRMMSLAVDMLRAALEIRMPDNQPVNLRIGLHTGPCVSGLVGLEVPKWSVFGDTVNTSARMEQTAVPGTIQISNATKRLLPNLDIGLEHNGAVAMKGKGTMETWLWLQPPEWKAARQTGIAPPLPKAIERLHRKCGIDASDGDANEEELPTVQLPAAFLPSTQLPSKRLPDPNSSWAKINGFSGFDASLHNKSAKWKDPKTLELAGRTSFSQAPSSRDTPTLLRRSSLPSIPSGPSNASMNGITLDDGKALEKVLGSGSSQTPSWNQTPALPQTAVPAHSISKKDPAISRALHRINDTSITLPLVVTEAMKGLPGHGHTPHSPTGTSTPPSRESPPPSLLTAATPKPSSAELSSAPTAEPTQKPTSHNASPFAAAVAGDCNSQGANRSALKECGSQRKTVDKLSWAPEPHTEGRSRRRSKASDEGKIEARESTDRVGTFGPKVFELLRVASNSPMSSSSQLESASWHRLNFSSLDARRTARSSLTTNILWRTSSSRQSRASLASQGVDLTALLVRSSLPMLATSYSLPLPSFPSSLLPQSESSSPPQARARRGAAQLSPLRRSPKGQVRVLQRCHSNPLPISDPALACASTSTRCGSQSGLKGCTSNRLSRARYRVPEGTQTIGPNRVHWGIAKPGRHRPQGVLSPQSVLKLPSNSAHAPHETPKHRLQLSAAVTAAAASSPVNMVRQMHQQGAVGTPSSTLKTGSGSTGQGMAKEEGSFSMPLKHKVAAMLEQEEEEEEAAAYGHESYGKSHAQSHAAYLAAKLATIPDRSTMSPSLARTSSKRHAWSRKVAHMSAGCNLVSSTTGMNSQANAIPSGSAFKGLARVQGMHNSQANALQTCGSMARSAHSQANALQHCSSMPRGLSRANTLGMSSQANAIFPAAGNSVYKTLAKAHAHIGTVQDQRQQNSPELTSGTGFARPSLAQARQNSGRRRSLMDGGADLGTSGTGFARPNLAQARQNSGRRSSMWSATPQSLQP